MEISIIGTGYVGLVSGVCLAEKGHQVICVDKDVEKIKKIKNAVSPIHEDGLNELLNTNVNKNMKVTTNLHDAVMNSQVSILAVGTPFNGKEIDLNYICEAVKEIGLVLHQKNKYHVVIVKSTVVPGTTDNVILPLLEKCSGRNAGEDFGVGMNPEFLREGSAVQDFMFPDRIVLGGIDRRTHELMGQLFDSFVGVDIIKTNNKTAEMIKYTSNSLLATMISFSNEIGNLCSTLRGIDAMEVMKGVHLDKRISPVLENGERVVTGITSYLKPGCGYGGSCFPKDIKALISHAENLKQPVPLLKAADEINNNQPKKMLEILIKHYPKFDKIKVAVLGLAFKPDTDDMRESPSIPIIKKLIEGNAMVSVYDPVALNNAKKIFEGLSINYSISIQQTLEGADAVLLLTSWSEFRAIPEILIKMGIDPLIIDGRRMLSKNSVKRYEGIAI